MKNYTCKMSIVLIVFGLIMLSTQSADARRGPVPPGKIDSNNGNVEKSGPASTSWKPQYEDGGENMYYAGSDFAARGYSSDYSRTGYTYTDPSAINKAPAARADDTYLPYNYIEPKKPGNIFEGLKNMWPFGQKKEEVKEYSPRHWDQTSTQTWKTQQAQPDWSQSNRGYMSHNISDSYSFDYYTPYEQKGINGVRGDKTFVPEGKLSHSGHRWVDADTKPKMGDYLGDLSKSTDHFVKASIGQEY